MKKFCASVSLALGLACAAPAFAAPAWYATPGVENPVTYTFTAAANGNIYAYFAGSTAQYTNELTLWVNGTATGIQGLNNQTSAYGDRLDFGPVQAGDVLIFELVNMVPGTVGPYYSDSSMNADGLNRVYSSVYEGDADVPAGVYVSFEDLPNGGDFNYNDESFVFLNVAAQAEGDVPEPASLALVLAGIAGFGVSRRFRRVR